MDFKQGLLYITYIDAVLKKTYI